MDLTFTVDEVADMLRTDKASYSHGYIQYYEQLFKDKRKEIKSVLELGIGDGGSLKLWKLYFPNALIYGLDMNENTFHFEDGISCYFFNQNDRDKLKETFRKKNLEVIIDDASHAEEETLISLDTLFPLLLSQGYYIIEDMNEKIPTKILDWIYVNRESVKSLSILPDKGTLKGENYEYLIVIQKQ